MRQAVVFAGFYGNAVLECVLGNDFPVIEETLSHMQA